MRAFGAAENKHNFCGGNSLVSKLIFRFSSAFLVAALALLLGQSNRLCAQLQPATPPTDALSSSNSWLNPNPLRPNSPVVKQWTSSRILASGNWEYPYPEQKIYTGPLTNQLPLRSQVVQPRGQLLEPIIPKIPARQPVANSNNTKSQYSVRLASFESEFSPSQDDEKKQEEEKEDTKQVETPVDPATTLVVDDISIKGLTQEIKEQTKLVNSDTADEETKKEQLKQLSTANVWIQKANTFQSFVTSQKAAQENFETVFQELQDQLESDLKPEPPAPNLSAEELQSRLQVIRQELQQQKTNLADNEDKMNKREERISKLPSDRTLALERLRKIKEDLTELDSQPDGLAKELSILNLHSQELSTKLEIEALDIEVPRQEQSGKLLPAQRDLINKKIQKLEAELRDWERAFNKGREREIELQLSDAKALLIEVQNDPALKKLAESNLELVKKRKDWTVEMDLAQADLKSADTQFNELESDLEGIKKDIKSQITTEIGMSLVKQRNKLVLPGFSYTKIEQIKRDLQTIRREALEWEESRNELRFPDQVVKGYVDGFEAKLSPVTTPPHLRTEQEKLAAASQSKAINDYELLTRNLVSSRITYLDALNKDFESYRAELIKEQNAREKLVNKINEIAGFIDEKALWVPSTKPIQLEDLHESRHAVEEFFRPSSWLDFLGQIKARMFARPERSMLGLFVFISLIVVSYRLKVNHD